MAKFDMHLTRMPNIKVGVAPQYDSDKYRMVEIAVALANYFIEVNGVD